MIKLTRLNDSEFVLNASMIKFLESRPDTIITLMSEEKVVVRENIEQVIDRIVEYERRVRTFAR